MFGWFKKRRRKKLLATPVPAERQGYVERNVRHWAYLDDTQRARLWERLRVIVAEKDWAAATGFQVTDEMRVGHYFKRATMIESQFGSADHHLARYEALTLPA